MKKPYIAIFLVSLGFAAFSMYFYGNMTGMMPMQSSVSRSARDMKGGVAMPSMGMSEKMMIAPSYPMPTEDGDAMNVAQRVYEYNSYHSVVVEDVSEYMKNIREYVLSVQGQILNTSQGKSDRYAYGSIYAKVPVKTFDQTTGKITENVKKIINESINTADRTGEMTRTTDNVQALKDELTIRQAELTEATLASDKARIQNQITTLQKRIEQAEQQTQNIQEQVEYATIQVSVTDDEAYFNPDARGSVSDELKKAIRSLGDSLQLLLIVAIWAAVYAVILVPLYLLLKWLKNRFFTSKTK